MRRLSVHQFAALAAAALLTAPTLVAQRGGFPTLRVPIGNPITPNKTLLGKALFFEEQMSSTSTMACATCHGLKTGGGSDPRSLQADSRHPGRDGRYGTADDKLGSKGVIRHNANGSYRPSAPFQTRVQVTDRRPMTVINAAFNRILMWDGKAGDQFFDPESTSTLLLGRDAALETQAAGPPMNDIEMAHFGESWASIKARLAKAKPLALATNVPTALKNFVANKTYPQLFAAAFGTSTINAARISMAIATYERTLISNQSRWDDFLRGNQRALTRSEQNGFRIFQNACDGCHAGALTTNNQFINTGVRPVIEDLGRQRITNRRDDRGRFRTPSLRNIALRAPYFHNGQARTLMDVVNFYNRGGDSRDNKDRRVRRLGLSSTQRQDLVNFLTSLTDSRVAAGTAPFDGPTLYTQSGHVPTLVGTGTAGTGNIAPEMIALEPASIGNPNFTLGLRSGLGGAQSILAIGTDTSTVGVPVGGAMTYVNLAPGVLLVPSGALSGSGAGQGYASLSIGLPNDPKLIGATLGAQWFVVDTGAGRSFSSTKAARIRAF